MAVPAVHEDMHQGAGRQQQPRQQAEHVGAVLADKEKPGDGGEAQKNPPSPPCLVPDPIVFGHFFLFGRFHRDTSISKPPKGGMIPIRA
jgi:hypothetical protein